MQNAVTRFILFMVMAAAVSGCAVIGGVFKAGVAVGIFAVVIGVILLFMLFGRR
jgi:hypothetical protein